MSISSELSRIRTAKSDIRTAIISKGVNVSSSATIDSYPALINAIVQTSSGDMRVITASPSGTINALDNCFYMLSSTAGTLTFTLPSTRVSANGVLLLFETDSSTNVTFTSYDGSTISITIAPDKCYLIDFKFANGAWTATTDSWYINGGGGGISMPSNLSQVSLDSWGNLTSLTTATSVTSIGDNA